MENLYCQNWNADIFTKSDSLEKLVQATLRPLPDYDNCFTHYIAYLNLLKPKHFECSLENGTGIKHKKVEKYIQGGKRSYKVNFTNLDDRYYCILFQPCAERCYNRYLQSNVIKIEENPSVWTNKNFVKELTSSTTKDIVYICGVLILALICSILIYWNYKHRKVRKLPKALIEEGINTPFLSSKNNKASDTEVTLCYYPNKNSREFVDDLADFFQKCAEFRVRVIDNRDPEIFVSGVTGYFEALFQSFCSKLDNDCVCNKRFLIVMTDHDLACMQPMMKNNNNLNEFHDDNMQADWFHYALEKIYSDCSKCLTDYIHFTAVYVGGIVKHDGIAIAPGVRFHIHHKNDVLELCQHLNNFYKEKLNADKLKSCLEEHPIKLILDNQ